MNSKDIGNRLNEIVSSARNTLFNQSELAQLTYNAFEITTRTVEAGLAETVDVTFPIGWTAGNQPIPHTNRYTKQELLERYRFLGLNFLPVNAIFHLVTVIEVMTNDLLQAVVRKYPQKLGSKKEIPLRVVLGASSIEAIHAHAIDTLLNDLSYKSPSEFAQSVNELMGMNLMECGAFHKYIELKATRDVYIHNRGFANDTYVRKAGLNARVTAGNFVPADINYFLASFEQCIQLTEWLEEQLHGKWHSSEYEARKNRPETQVEHDPAGAGDVVSEKLRELAAKLAKGPQDGGVA